MRPDQSGTVASRSTLFTMSRRTQEPSRLLTRSMASNSIRRSARLRNKRGLGSSATSSLRPKPTELGVRRDPTKYRRLLVVLEEHKSKLRKECGPVRVVQAKPRLRRTDSREKVLSRKSSDLTAAFCDEEFSRVKDLEEQLETALQAKQELADQVKENNFCSAQLSLKHLEDYFTCPLCFEVMACPYSLTPRICGHTFCATCILKWVFSRLHKGCGGWHETVDCPLCRTSLPHTPERTPRPASSFPFTPNRTADAAIRGLIATLSRESTGPSTTRSNSLDDWDEGGHSKQEWSKREKIGRVVMTSMAAQWSSMKAVDFVDIKNRLEV